MAVIRVLRAHGCAQEVSDSNVLGGGLSQALLSERAEAARGALHDPLRGQARAAPRRADAHGVRRVEPEARVPVPKDGRAVASSRSPGVSTPAVLAAAGESDTYPDRR